MKRLVTIHPMFVDAQWTNKDRLSDALLRDLISHFSQLSLGNASAEADVLGNPRLALCCLHGVWSTTLSGRSAFPEELARLLGYGHSVPTKPSPPLFVAPLSRRFAKGWCDCLCATSRPVWKLVLNGNRPTSNDEAGLPSTKGPTKAPRAEPPALVELFNLAKDPYEKTTVATDQPARVAEMRARYDALARQAAPPKNHASAPGYKAPAVWGEEP